jgi:hypothetical protein
MAVTRKPLFRVITILILNLLLFASNGWTQTNSPPVVTENQVFLVNEDATAGTIVGTVEASDEDGDSLQYSITEGNENGDFAIDSAIGTISVVNPPDFESQPSYSLTVEVYDGLAADSATVTIIVLDLVATISGSVFNDSNVNGFWDGGEEGLYGVTVTLSNNIISTVTTTNNWGDYSFEVETPGTYTITETDLLIPEPCIVFYSTTAIPGEGFVKIDANTLQGDITAEDIENQIHFGDNLFGDVEVVGSVLTITGVVWQDLDADGQRNNDEPGLVGSVVSLSSGLTQTTSSDGFFTLYAPTDTITVTCNYPDDYIPTNAIPGDAAIAVDNYTIVVDGKQLCDNQNKCPCGPTSANNLFGAILPSSIATISGTVFNDVNENGELDEGEMGLEGVQVTMKIDDDGTIFVQTDSDGYYEFAVDTGTDVRITSAGPGGVYYPTTPESILVRPLEARVYLVNFGYSSPPPPAIIYGLVFEDINANGQRDFGEPGLAGATISLDNTTSITTTGNGLITGTFLFEVTEEGIHTLIETNPEGYQSTTPDAVSVDVVLGNNYLIEFGDTVIDLCPNDPNKIQPGICGCGVPDIDSDADEIPDCTDVCPDDPNPDQGDTDVDGVGDVCDLCTDTDNDSYGNPGFPANNCFTDNCPDDSNIGQADADIDGIGDVCDPCTDIDDDDYGIGEECQGEDCDDNDPDINPEATELCDDIDNDCDGEIDEGVKNTYYLDSDDDGYGDPAQSIQACTPPEDYVENNHDSCPDSNLEKTITMEGCDSGVGNQLFEDGCTMSDLIAECAEGAKNHGKFVSRVSHLTNDWKKAGLISGKDKGKIQKCAAKADIP